MSKHQYYAEIFIPKYKALVDAIYPEDQHSGVAREELTDLMVYAMKSRWKNINLIGGYILEKTQSDVSSRRHRYAMIGLEALDHIVNCAAKYCQFYGTFYGLIKQILSSDMEPLRKYASSKISRRRCQSLIRTENKCKKKVSRIPKLAAIVEEVEVWKYPFLVH